MTNSEAYEEVKHLLTCRIVATNYDWIRIIPYSLELSMYTPAEQLNFLQKFKYKESQRNSPITNFEPEPEHYYQDMLKSLEKRLFND